MTTLETVRLLIAIDVALNAAILIWLGYVYWAERPSRRECDAARYLEIEVSP